jgi:hypothetical protein
MNAFHTITNRLRLCPQKFYPISTNEDLGWAETSMEYVIRNKPEPSN